MANDPDNNGSNRKLWYAAALAACALFGAIGDVGSGVKSVVETFFGTPAPPQPANVATNVPTDSVQADVPVIDDQRDDSPDTAPGGNTATALQPAQATGQVDDIALPTWQPEDALPPSPGTPSERPSDVSDARVQADDATRSVGAGRWTRPCGTQGMPACDQSR